MKNGVPPQENEHLTMTFPPTCFHVSLEFSVLHENILLFGFITEFGCSVFTIKIQYNWNVYVNLNLSVTRMDWYELYSSVDIFISMQVEIYVDILALFMLLNSLSWKVQWNNIYSEQAQHRLNRRSSCIVVVEP